MPDLIRHPEGIEKTGFPDKSGNDKKTGMTKKDKTTIYYITDKGNALAQRLKGEFSDAEIIKFNTSEFAGRWHSAKNIICIMATGIVVRAMAFLLEDKKTDPAVIVLDETGKYAISLLSGHIGGANALARKVADLLGARAVITTASDVQGKIALDLWAIEKKLFIEDLEKLKKLSAGIVNGWKIRIYSDYPYDAGQMPDEFIMVGFRESPDIVISHKNSESNALYMRPGNLFVGVGCNRGTSGEEVKEVVTSLFERENLSVCSIKGIATVDLKKDEPGLIDFARDNGMNIEFFSSDELNDASSAYNIKESGTVKAATGAVAVAEPAAVLSAKKASGKCTIIMPKEKRGNVTLAIAKAEFTL
jgi:cobalamin biosynthesis protein CbiG